MSSRTSNSTHSLPYLLTYFDSSACRPGYATADCVCLSCTLRRSCSLADDVCAPINLLDCLPGKHLGRLPGNHRFPFPRHRKYGTPTPPYYHAEQGRKIKKALASKCRGDKSHNGPQTSRKITLVLFVWYKIISDTPMRIRE